MTALIVLNRLNRESHYLEDCVRPRGLCVGVGGVLRAVGVAALQEVEEAGGVGRAVHGQAGDRHALNAVLTQGQLLAWSGEDGLWFECLRRLFLNPLCRHVCLVTYNVCSKVGAFAHVLHQYSLPLMYRVLLFTWVDEVDDLLVVDLHIGDGDLRGRRRLRLLHPLVQRHHSLERQPGVRGGAEHGVRLARPRRAVHEHGAVVPDYDNAQLIIFIINN